MPITTAHTWEDCPFLPSSFYRQQCWPPESSVKGMGGLGFRDEEGMQGFWKVSKKHLSAHSVAFSCLCPTPRLGYLAAILPESLSEGECRQTSMS